jgi:glyoxylase-like metal-dependent hydrolase (beta-lactamase superfamily II)
MLFETQAAPPFFKNGFVLGCEETREGVLIDPGDEAGLLLDYVEQERLVIRFVLVTHAHVDHVSGLACVRRLVDAPIGLHRDDAFLYEIALQQGRAFGYAIEAPPPVDFFYDLAAPLTFGRYAVRVHHTPGHSPGGVCLQVGRADEAGQDLFVGDTLFAGSIGRTDLPGGDMATLLRSIRTVLFPFGDDARVYPGHGPQTTIGAERRSNPFLTA